MKNILAMLFVLFISNNSFGQKIISGSYSDGLKIYYDSSTNKLTGYFEQYGGWDEETKRPKFSCIYYIEGDVIGEKFKVKTYFPNRKSDDIIEGTIEIVNNKTLTIKLPEDHGGCWNIQEFVHEPVKFGLEKQENWIQIKYVRVDKAYFYKEKSIDTKRKAYLIKSNFVCIEKIENDWAFCTFFGDKITKGWMKLNELN